MRASRAEREPSREELASRIERVSAEGRPGDPTLGKRRIIVLLLLAGLSFIFAGFVLGITINWPTGLVVAIVGLTIFLLSPIFWAAVLRARERGRVREQLQRQR